ncbi:MAG: hypothetical protein HQK53_14545 [Oligoflexia bacterium]|nr:hypothetical protein [Oligoflexia bacterium]
MFLYLGAERVYGPDDDFNPSQMEGGRVIHIDLAKWCDRMIIAPLSANTLSRLVRGEGSDLLTTTFLALANKPVVAYPAMNYNMLEHPFTAENLKKLGTLPNLFVHPPSEGTLACGDSGKGKLPPVNSIIDLAPYLPIKRPTVKRPMQTMRKTQTILITTGATVSPLDPVRYLNNPSSGLTGYYLAREFLSRGERVIVIAGVHSSDKLDYLNSLGMSPSECKVERVRTTSEMSQAVFRYFDQCDLYISAAAIADIEFDISKEKLKKGKSGEQGTLLYRVAEDILQEALRRRRGSQKIVGFAAESEVTPDVLQEKLQRKPVDLLVANQVDNGLLSPVGQMKGFCVESGHYYFVQSKSTVIDEKTFSKVCLAKYLADILTKSME